MELSGGEGSPPAARAEGRGSAPVARAGAAHRRICSARSEVGPLATGMELPRRGGARAATWCAGASGKRAAEKEGRRQRCTSMGGESNNEPPAPVGKASGRGASARAGRNVSRIFQIAGVPLRFGHRLFLAYKRTHDGWTWARRNLFGGIFRDERLTTRL